MSTLHPTFSANNPFFRYLSDPLGLAQQAQAYPVAPATPRPRGPRQLPVPPTPFHHHVFQQHQTRPAAPLQGHQPPPGFPVAHQYYTPSVSSESVHPHAPYMHHPPQQSYYDPNGPAASVSGHLAAVGPVPKVFSLSVGGWLETDRLSLERNNWIPWSTRVKLELGLQPGATRFLGGDNPCPSFTMFPGHHRAWLDTDAVVRAVLTSVYAVTERECFAEETTAAAVWSTLRRRHEHRGPIGQIKALRKFVATKYSRDPATFSATTTELSNLNSSIWAAGPVNANSFLLAGMLAALTPHHRKFVAAMLAIPQLDLPTLKENLLTMHEFNEDDDGDTANAANAAQAKSKPAGTQKKPHCVNPVCPKPDTHSWPYCTSPGGGMAGQTVQEAINKYRADTGRANSGGNNSTGNGSLHYSRGHEGTDYLITPNATPPPNPPAPQPAAVPTQTPCAHLAHVHNDALPTATLCTDALPAVGDYDSWSALNDPHVSLDWAAEANIVAAARHDDFFTIFADSGANVHISPCREDFITFTEIPPRPIRGFQGTSVHATGIGTIVTDKFVLHNVLYVPNASIRLLSVLRLCQSQLFTFHFDSTRAWISSPTQGVVCTGSIHPTRNLYQLDCRPIPIPPAPTASAATAAARDLRSWHLCFGHANHQSVADLYQHDLVDGMDLDPSSDAPVCDACIRGKQARANIPKVREGPKSTRRLEQAHVDLSGKVAVKSRSGNLYTLDIVDDYATRGWCIPIPNKAAAFPFLQAWAMGIEARTGERIGCINIDNGELKSDEFEQWCARRGTQIKYTAPHVSKQNGKVERFHRTIHAKARAMRIYCNAPPNMWDEFCLTAAYLQARTPSSSQDGRTPHECFERVKPNVAHLREIGCRAFVLIEDNNPKVYERSIECIYNSINVRFIESGQMEKIVWNKERLAERLARQQTPPAAAVPDDQSSDDPILTTSALPTAADDARAVPTPITVPMSTPTHTSPSDSTSSTPAPDLSPTPPLRRSTRDRRPARDRTALAAEDDGEDDGELKILEDIAETIAATPEDDDGEEDAMWAELNAYLTDNPIDVEFPDDPRNYTEAMAAPDADKWIEGTHEELRSLREYGVYELIPRSEVPLNKTILDLKPVYTRKRDISMAGDYTHTTSPTARLESFRAVLHVAAARGWDIQQVDVKTAFLNADLPPDEYQYARQPRHFEEAGKETAWNRHMHEAMLEWGFRRLICEWCVYVRRLPDGTTNLVAVHVDDMLSAASSVAANDAFKAQLRSKWAITDLGDAQFCLGIAIVRDPERRTVSLSQTALIDRIIEQFHQTDAYAVATPMETKLNLQRSESITLSREDAERLATIPFRALVGSLMYLSIGTRPDIAFAVNRLAGFLSCYTLAHWQAAIRVVRYLKGTRNLSLTLGGAVDHSFSVLLCSKEKKKKDPITLAGHSDTDYANDPDQRKSIMGYTFSLGSGAISWASRKQKVVALSSAEAEYIGASEAAKEACWLRMLSRGIGLTVDSPTPILCDNNATIPLASDQSFHSRAKHIDTRYHHIRDCVEKQKIYLPRVASRDNVADTLTKALPAPDFLCHRASLGLE
ncbi:Integrase catalytic domain-containing protein [Mycena venus]|uniref:Integrase catalytic domain-containing protein n=1 Tax=Mycena venus TaxID=2733690 RepID=A0A8H6Z8D7_9AGAR|nr:Integrase catalytic domain-containing protein [Mycena venus]